MGRYSSSKMVLWTILLAAAPLLVSSAGDTNFGLKMITKAGKGVCWLEKLHKPYPIDEQGVNFGTSEMNMPFADNEWDKQVKFQTDNIKSQGVDPNDFQDAIKDHAMSNMKGNYIKPKLIQLPSVYRSCQKYVDTENVAPAKDMSSVLGDSSAGQYPFKAVAHCLMEVAERQNGKKNMADLKTQWNSPKTFHQAILDRENENRARHGTPPLTLDPELNAHAQRWAEKLAAANVCGMIHITDGEPDKAYKGGTCGENLHQDGYKAGDDDNIGVGAANGWYSEIKDYPWPQYTLNNARETIGHFTQSVWKSTKLAGYGIARSPGCNKVLVVARYYPAGNMKNASYYKDNVLPVQG